MGKFDRYFLMQEQDVKEYVLQKLTVFDWDRATMRCTEIGDGNLNYVFRVFDGQGHSVIVKHAGESLRISDDMHISTDRNRIESEILMLQNQLAPGLVPKIYFYDTTMCACAMEDMTGYRLMRYGLMDHKIYPRFAEDCSTFMANVLMGTSDLCMEPKKKKELQRSFINPELCEITEDLVYTEPYNDCRGRNHVFAPNAQFVQKELYDDEKLHLETAKLKIQFMTDAQALLHGDLHTGSIFVREDATRFFDPEFAFFGPMGYDSGNVVANLLFARCNGEAVMEPSPEKEQFLAWIDSSIEQVVDLFLAKMKTYCHLHAVEKTAQTPGFLDWYLQGVLHDTAACAGLELNRRIVGMANVKDITGIADPQKRLRAERICILTAKKYIMQRNSFACGGDLVRVFKETVREYDGR